MAPRRKPLRPQPERASTIVDVAREAGVSVATVSRVVNGNPNVTPETRRRIEAIVGRLRYVPHTAARSLVTKRSHMIGVLLPDLYGEFFSELIRGIDAAARELGLHLLLSSSHDDASEMAAAVRAMHGRVEGLVILAPQLEGVRILDRTTPTVFINSKVPAGESPLLAIDSYGGARAMVRHLVAAGHRSIAHIAGPVDNFDAHERERGYRDELAASLRGVRPHVIRGDFTEASGFAACRELARAAGAARPAAVFAGNDMMALGCLAGLGAAGLTVPRDIALAGFDDVPLAAYARPALTTMRVPIFELGRGAVTQLAAAIAVRGEPPEAAPPPILFEPELVIRDTCGSAARRAPRRDGGSDGHAPPDPRSRSRSTPRKRRALSR
jgi:LacI family transcriptional regulator